MRTEVHQPRQSGKCYQMPSNAQTHGQDAQKAKQKLALEIADPISHYEKELASVLGKNQTNLAQLAIYYNNIYSYVIG